MPDHTNSEIGTSEHPTPPWPNGQPSPQPNSATHAPLPAQGAPSLPVSRDGAFEGDAEALNAYRTLEARKKRRRRNRIIAGCVVGALALAGIGWWLSNSLSQATSSESSEASFSVEQVTEGTFESSVSASGAIKPASQVVVTPEVDGIVENVLVAEGDLVQAGDVLFTLRNASLDKAVQDAEQALKTAENNVASSQNALDSAVNAQARAQESYDKVFSTEYETQEEADAAGNQATDALSSANNAVRDAQLALDNAQLAVTTAREALDLANDTAKKRTVTAPQAGAIVALGAVAGASVGGSAAGGTAQSGSGSLATIADLSMLRVSVKVNEVDINNLSEGQVAEVTFSALPDVTLSAEVEHIAAIASSGTEPQGGATGVVTYDVTLVIAQPDPHVKPGMTARVKILTQRVDDAVIVPLSALSMIDDSNASVLVAQGGSEDGQYQFEERMVQVVARNATSAAVEGDVHGGDVVQIISESDGNDDFADAEMAG